MQLPVMAQMTSELHLQVVVYGCQNLMYCGRGLEVSTDGTTWSTVYDTDNAYDN